MPSQVIDWIVRLLTPLIAGVVGALIAYRWRRGDEKRDSHLAELRTEVFGPMLEYLDEYVLPILRREAGNVDVRIRQMPNPPGLTQRPSFEQALSMRMVTEPFQDHTFGMGAVPVLPPPPAGPLVDDARRHHFADLFHTWDALIVRFQEYNDACLRYAESLRAQIIERNRPLPQFTSQTDILGTEWINAAALAVIIFLRQIGLLVRELTSRPEGGHEGEVDICSYNSLMVARAAPAKMVALVAHVDELVGHREEVQELLTTAEPLAADVAALRATVDELRLRRRLSGKCPYL